MAIITGTIGTAARNYSTLQAWEDAVPAGVVASGNSYVGECYNDSEFAALLVISGHTTDATHTITLQCATGQGFTQHATKATNRVAYDQTKGVGQRITTGYNQAITVNDSYVTIDGIQSKSTAAPSDGLLVNSTATNVVIKNCIFQSKSAARVVRLTTSTQKIINSLIVQDVANTIPAIHLESASQAINCTLVRPSNYAAGGPATTSVYGAAVVKNCAMFGFAADSTGSYAADGHNVTGHTTAPGTTSNLVSKVYANQFVQPSNAANAEDYRLKTGADCIDTGVTDSITSPDMFGTTRTTFDVGAVEFVAAATGTTITPAAGALTLTGYAPALAQTANQSLTPAAGALAVTGYAPAVVVNQIINPSVGQLALTGYAPAVAQSINQGVTPATGTLAITGYAPTVASSANQSVAPSAGTLTLAGYAPVVSASANQAVFPALGSLVTTGYAPNVAQASASQSLSPGPVSLAITGYEPTILQSGGAGRKKFQVQTTRGVVEVATLDEVAQIVREQKRVPKADPVEVKLQGLKVSTPSIKPGKDYAAIEANLRAQVQAEMDEEEELLLMLL